MAGVNTLAGGFNAVDENSGGSVTPETGSVHYDVVQHLSSEEKQRAKDNIGADYSNKADKVSGADNNELAALNSNGNLKKSGIAVDDVFIKGTKSSETTVGLAENIESWNQNTQSSEYVHTSAVDTAGGEISIDSSVASQLMSVKATSDFYAQQLVCTGFNLLRHAVAVGDGWYIEVPHLVATQASIGTALENNGVLFTNAQGQNMTPTVYFKALANGVPSGVTDGAAATYTDKNGRRHYTTSGPGYLIVSGIDRAATCAHMGWSGKYDTYVSVTDADDAGTVVDAATIIHAIHDNNKMLVVGPVADNFKRVNDTTIQWCRPVDLVQPTWQNTAVEEEGVATGQYLHTAEISNMKAGGYASFLDNVQNLSVEGNTVSYTDSNATAITDYVKFELDAEVTGTMSVSSLLNVNDWGLVILRGATGAAEVSIAYTQNIPDNLRTSLPVINDLRHCTGSISQGFATCINGTYDANKVVTIEHFLLLQYGLINVLFTAPINTEHATLNVSGTGAKPIRILGQDLPAGAVKAQTYCQLVYDGVAWNIINMFRPDASFDPAGLVVDMGLPSGVKWAARDIDLTKPGGFCETPFVYEKSFFSWGNIDGHNPANGSFANIHNWGSVNAADPWYENQPYGTTPGATLAGDIAVGESYDAARANLGEPWRMPTNAEYGELFANIDYLNADGTVKSADETDKRSIVNGITGLWLQSKINGNKLFFACSGYGDGSSWYNRGSNGYYWSASFDSARDARFLVFYSGGVYPQNNFYRYCGFAVRPVQ